MMRKNMRGFTLAEIIIVLGIAITLTAILITYTRSGERQIVFFKEQSVLVSTILRAKAFAIETFQPKLQPGLTPPDEIICGWGVSFDKLSHKYTIFKDLAEKGKKDCKNASRSFDHSEEKFEEFIFPSIIEISCLDLMKTSNSNCSASKDRIDIVFIPPDPKTVFFPKDPNTLEAVIAIELDDKSRQSVIRVTRAGQISFR